MSVKGVIVLSAYKRNDSTAGESFAVIKGAHFKMGRFSVSAKLYLSWRDTDSFPALSWHQAEGGSSGMEMLFGKKGWWAGE